MAKMNQIFLVRKGGGINFGAFLIRVLMIYRKTTKVAWSERET